MTTHEMVEPPLRTPDLEDELTAVLCAAIRWGGSAISSEEYIAAKQRFRAAVNAAIEADRQARDEPVGYIMPTALKQLKAGGHAVVGGVSQGFDIPIYTAPQPADPVAYHPCTSILIEGLKRLPGGSAILAEWDKARSKVDTPQPTESVHETARTAGNSAGIGVNTGPQGGAHSASSYSGCGCNSDDCRVNGCLSLRQAQSAMAPGGGGMPAEPVNKTDWNAELASWSDEDFVQVFHERPDLANRLRKMLAEPVKVPSDADAKHIRDFIACDGMGAVIVEGPQYSAVVRALLARYGNPMT